MALEVSLFVPDAVAGLTPISPPETNIDSFQRKAYQGLMKRNPWGHYPITSIDPSTVSAKLSFAY
jgi:hypothetical protein